MAGWADRVTLKNGRTIRGRIIDRTDARLTFQTPSGTFSFHLRDINKIEEELPAENLLHIAELAFARKDAVSALNAYTKARTLGLAPSRLREHFLSHQLALDSALHYASAAEKEKIGTLLMTLIPQNLETLASDSATTRSREFAFTLAEFFSETGRADEAAKILSQLPRRYYDTFPQKRTFTVEFFKAEAMRRVSAGDFNGAVLLIENLYLLNTTAGRSGRILLYLRWGARLCEQEQWEAAAAIYAHKLAPLSSELATNRLELLFDKMEKSAQSESDFNTLIMLVKKYAPFIPPTQTLSRLARLFVSAGNCCLDDGRTTDARQLFKASFRISGRENPLLLARCDYVERAASLRSDDFVGHYHLARFCREHALEDEARKHFQIASEAPELKSAALTELHILKTRCRIKSLHNALNLYDNAEYACALDKLQTILSDNSTTAALAEASRLADLCRKQLKSESDKRPIKALIYYQQAERYFLLEDYDSALLKLDLLLDRFPDAPVAPKARALMLKTLMRRDIARLEKSPHKATSPGVVPRHIPAETDALKSQINKLLNSLDDEQ